MDDTQAEQSTESQTPATGGASMEFLVLAAVFVVWIVLQAWVLPRFGVAT